MKRLSVIIPGYDNPKWRWTRCLESVAAALTPDDEVIIVDDGSAEPFEASILPEAPNFPRACFRVVRLPQNGGQAAARNAGLSVASGEFVTFVDSDDALKGNPYEACIAKLRETGADVAVYGVNVIWAAEGLQKHDLPSAADVETLHRECLFNYAVNKVIRKRFLDERDIRFDVDGMPCEDVMFYLRTVLSGAKWCAVPVEGYVYYLNANGSQVTRYEKRYAKGTTAAAKMWREYCEGRPGASDYLRALALTEAQVTQGEWVNIWKAGSPYSLVARRKWGAEHGFGLAAFLKMAVRTAVRRWFYFKPLRRIHYRSLYANVLPFGS